MTDPAQPVAPTGRYLRDVAERVLRAFVLSFAALMAEEAAKTTAIGHVMTVARGAVIASYITAFVLVVSLVAKFVNNPDSASLAKGV